jgi:hypothetical protein
MKGELLWLMTLSYHHEISFTSQISVEKTPRNSMTLRLTNPVATENIKNNAVPPTFVEVWKHMVESYL